MKAMADLVTLVARLTKASKAYYTGTPVMTDDEFDALRDLLKKADPGHPFLKQVGAPASNTLKKVKLAARMGSLDNAFEATEIEAWVTRVTKLAGIAPTKVVLQPKLDGLSVQLSYRNCKLVMAATRGDGMEGEDVTANVMRAKGVPRIISNKADLEIRGEMVVLKDDFEKHFKPRGDANPRNSAAGTVRRTDGALAEHLSFIAFDMHGIHCSTEADIIELLTAWKFSPASTVKLDFVAKDIIAAWEKYGAARQSLPYIVDGCVVKVSDRMTSLKLGWADACPRGAIACKWRGSMVAETEIIGVENSVGHTGVITPVAIVKPVDCGGVTIRNISLMNWDEVGRLSTVHQLGIGSRVRIERAGDVIPRVIATLSAPTKPLTRPTSCPSCDHDTVVDGPRQMCTNPTCPAQAMRTVMRWVKGRNILHLGEETVDRLMAMHGPVSTIADLYKLTRDQMKSGTGGYAMADKILVELEKSKSCTLTQVFGNLGIAGIGETEAGKVCDYLSAVDISDVMAAPVNAYAAAIGDVRGRKFADGMIENAQILRELIPVLKIVAPPKKVTSGEFAGKQFCITGPTEINRTSLIGIIEGAGGTWKSSVVNGLDYLIAADVSDNKDDWSNKLKEADRKGVKVLSEAAALKMAKYT